MVTVNDSEGMCSSVENVLVIYGYTWSVVLVRFKLYYVTLFCCISAAVPSAGRCELLHFCCCSISGEVSVTAFLLLFHQRGGVSLIQFDMINVMFFIQQTVYSFILHHSPGHVFFKD